MAADPGYVKHSDAFLVFAARLAYPKSITIAGLWRLLGLLRGDGDHPLGRGRGHATLPWRDRRLHDRDADGDGEIDTVKLMFR